MEPIIIKLQHPVSFGGKLVEEVKIARRPKTKDILGMNLNNMKTDDMILFVARLTGELPAMIGNLDLVDFMSLVDIVTPFLEPTPKI